MISAQVLPQKPDQSFGAKKTHYIITAFYLPVNMVNVPNPLKVFLIFPDPFGGHKKRQVSFPDICRF